MMNFCIPASICECYLLQYSGYIGCRARKCTSVQSTGYAVLCQRSELPHISATVFMVPEHSPYSKAKGTPE